MEIFDIGKNSELQKFTGKVTWVRMVQLNKYDKWSLNFYPDRESLDRIRDLQAEGIKNVVKKDDDGYFLQISRPSTVEFRKGVKTPVTQPRVTHSDGRSMEDVAIGNMSSGVVTCEVYSHAVPNSEKRAKAMRLYGLEVTDLVPFVSDKEASQPWNGQTS
jgi:hypothetical protein